MQIPRKYGRILFWIILIIILIANYFIWKDIFTGKKEKPVPGNEKIV